MMMDPLKECKWGCLRDYPLGEEEPAHPLEEEEPAHPLEEEEHVGGWVEEPVMRSGL